MERHIDLAAGMKSMRLPSAGRHSSRDAVNGIVSHPVNERLGSLLLVSDGTASRARLERALAAKGFAVTGVGDGQAALAAAAETGFSYAIVDLGFERPRYDRSAAFNLIRRLRALDDAMRIVVITDHDSFASVVLALRAGADDYLSKPINEAELTEALLGRSSILPPIPETPLRIERIRWEHIQRVLEQCGRNISEAARRLRMHRRSLQRVLKKRAPHPRGVHLACPTEAMRTGTATQTGSSLARLGMPAGLLGQPS